MKPEDLNYALEVARIALSHPRIRDRIADEMDLSDESIKEIEDSILKELQ